MGGVCSRVTTATVHVNGEGASAVGKHAPSLTNGGNNSTSMHFGTDEDTWGHSVSKSNARSRLHGMHRGEAGGELEHVEDLKLGDFVPEDVANLREYMRACVLCSSLDDKQLEDVVSRMQRLDLKGGESSNVAGVLGVLFRGSAIISEAVVETKASSGTATKERMLTAGASFGELDMLHDSPDDLPQGAGFVKASAESVICYLQRAQFRKILEFTQHTLISTNEALLRSMPMCEHMTGPERIKIASALTLEVLEDGDRAITEGETGDKFYIVREGKVSVRRQGKQIDYKYKGDFFGEAALLNDAPRNATIVCLGHVELLTMGKRDFLALLGPLQDILNRSEDDDKRSMLAGVSLLSTLTAQERQHLVQHLREVSFVEGHTIFAEGQRGDALFILRSGEVTVTKNGKRIDQLGAGAFFGERALINDEPRMATIAAKTDVEAMTLSREDFNSILSTQKDLQRLVADRHHTEDTRRIGDLRVLRLVGKGASGKVHLLYHTATGNVYALKSMRKKAQASKEQQVRVIRERRILGEMLPHPMVGALYNTYQDEDRLYMLLEYLSGGEVYSVLQAQGRFSEAQAKFYAACVTEAFEHLHRQGIIYRDLKPENLILSGKGYAKVVDMGISRWLSPTKKAYTTCGTPCYLSPEMIQHLGHDKGVDWWTLGVLIYEFITGETPFKGESALEMYDNIVTLKYTFPPQFPLKAVPIVKGLLTAKSAHRLGNLKNDADDVKAMPWFDDISWEQLYRGELKVKPIEQLLADYMDKSCPLDEIVHLIEPGHKEYWVQW